MNKLPAIFLLVLAVFSHNLLATTAQEIPKQKTYKYNFSKNDPFIVSYADYPIGEEQFFELSSGYTRLPSEIISNQQSLKISGNNHSDDLFMYAYKKLKGLKPNTRYQVSFSLEFASNATTGTPGAGGAAGDSVYMKIGMVSQKPTRYIDSANYYRMTLDKGNQGSDGKDMMLIGTIGVDNHPSLYRLKTLPYEPSEEILERINNYQFTSSENGEDWLVFGTDSGYESTSTLFYTGLSVTFKEIN